MAPVGPPSYSASVWGFACVAVVFPGRFYPHRPSSRSALAVKAADMKANPQPLFEGVQSPELSLMTPIETSVSSRTMRTSSRSARVSKLSSKPQRTMGSSGPTARSNALTTSPLKRQVIAIFADQHVRHEAGTGPPTFDQAGRQRGLGGPK